MDAKLDTIVGEFKARLDELVPGGSREKSLAVTNVEQAQLWAERARQVSGDNPLRFRTYSHPDTVGYLGVVEGKGGVEAWIAADGTVVPAESVWSGAVPEPPALEA